MSKDVGSGSRRAWQRGRIVLAATLALVVAAGNAALADTSGTPDPSTTAGLAPVAPTAAPGTTFGGVVGGQVVNVRVEGAPGSLHRVVARLCRSGLDVTYPAQLDPTSSGSCISAPFAGAPNDAVVDASAAPDDTSVAFPFAFGSGGQTFPYAGGTATIACDADHPCALWLQEDVDASVEGSGHVFKHYDVTYAGPPGVPGVAVAPGDHELRVDISSPATTGNAPLTSYRVSIDPGGTRVLPASTTTTTFTGLSNLVPYAVSVVATNTAADGTTHFDSDAAIVRATPVPPAPGAPSGTPAPGAVNLSWTAPPGSAPSAYEVVATPTNPVGPDVVQSSSGTTHLFTGLVNGTVYTFKVRAKYGTTTGGYSASSDGVVPTAALMSETVLTRRPNGALVLTQVCGAHGALTTGTAPTFEGGPDPLFPDYPYPQDANGDAIANYPTDCGVRLGTARLITSGAASGQFFEASGWLNQLTIADSREPDPGFTVTGVMGPFTSGSHSFSGGQLGWVPHKTSDTSPFIDSEGVTYDQQLSAGPPIEPNRSDGLAIGQMLGSAPPGAGLGIGVLDADLLLLIPVHAMTGDYTGTLTITAI